MTITALPDYRSAILAKGAGMLDVAERRSALTKVRGSLKAAEALILIDGVEGTNQAQRDANLVLRCEADGDYCAIRQTIREMEGELAEAEAALSVASEFCRLYYGELLAAAAGT